MPIRSRAAIASAASAFAAESTTKKRAAEAALFEHARFPAG
jgi:hypothetical protein